MRTDLHPADHPLPSPLFPEQVGRRFLTAERPLNRTFLLVTVVLASFFLVFLGMRLPSLKKNSRPKPNPRAVIEKSENDSPEAGKKLIPDVVACHTTTIPLSLRIAVVLTLSPLPAVAAIDPPSAARAPPRLTLS